MLRKPSSHRSGFSRSAWRAAQFELLESRLLLAATPSPFSEVISFTGQSNNGGTHPDSLVRDAAGDIFGTSRSGGLHNYGTIFEIAAGTSTVVSLADFTGGDAGFGPTGNLVLENGNLYGATTSGGVFTRGTIFQFNLASHTLTTLASLGVGNGGSYPTSGLASDGNGNLYGTTFGVTQQPATIFRYTIATGSLQTLVVLPLGDHIDTGVATDAATGLVEIANAGSANGVGTGTIFSTTVNGGANGRGRIISYDLGVGAAAVRTVVSFDGTHGNGPIGSLLFVNNSDAAGDPGLVGLASGGGVRNNGAVFDASLVSSNGIFSGTLTSLGSFTGAVGSRPVGSLLLVDSSNAPTGTLLGNTLYGVTASGGGNGNGAVFKITNAAPKSNGALVPAFTHNAFTKLTGQNPSGGLVIAPDGTLTGTTAEQGQFLDGTLFVLPPTAPAATGTRLVFSVLPTTGTAGVALGATTANPAGAVVVKIEDAAGRIVAGDNSHVTLQVATQAGAIVPITVAAVNGIATFSNVTLTKSGTYTLLATDGGMSGQSGALVISAAAASQLAVFQQPTLATTTGPTILVIHVEDAFGNIVTGDSSKVTITTASGPAAPKGTTTLNANHGVARFRNLLLPAPGTYTLRATDGALAGALTMPITVGLPATHLAFTEVPPANLQPGTGFTIQVALLDANNQVAATDTSAVRLVLTSHPGGAALVGPVIADVIDGVATFSSLQLFSAGTFSLRATDGLFSAISGSFEVGFVQPAVVG